MELKLNNKRTILVGLAFLSISAFWQMYDSVMTLILTGTFQLNETVSGAIMAADNVLACSCCPCSGPSPTGRRPGSAGGCPSSWAAPPPRWCS